MQTFSKFLLVLIAFMLVFLVVSRAQDTLHIQELGTYVKVKETPTVLIDNIDANIVYNNAANWINGETTAPGFYPSAPAKPTIAYSSTTGSTATFEFTGTYLEVFCEKKENAGHGSGAFQIDNQAAETIALGVAGPVGSTSVFKRDNLPPGKHTFKLTVAGGGNVVFDYLKIKGAAVAPTPPPVTGAIFLMPGVSMKTVVESASANTKFQLGNGSYPENVVNVPPGVSILPPTTGIAYIDVPVAHRPPTDAPTRDVAVFRFQSTGARVNGNQTISGFTLRGAYKATGGIIVDNRDNVRILNVKIQECNFSGVWLRNTIGSELANSEILNNSWASEGWVSGEVNVFNIRANIHDNKISNNKTDPTTGLSAKGYGIKALYQDGTIGGHIYNNKIDLPPTSLWNKGQSPNISIEFNDAIPDGLEMDHNDVANGISLAFHNNTKSGRIYSHDNNLTRLTSNSTFAYEIVCSNVTIENDIIKGSAMFTANYNPVAGQNNGHWTDIIIKNNNFTSNGSNPSWGATFLLGAGGMDMTITNNILNTGSYTRVKHTGPTSASQITQTGNTPAP